MYCKYTDVYWAIEQLSERRIWYRYFKAVNGNMEDPITPEQDARYQQSSGGAVLRRIFCDGL